MLYMKCFGFTVIPYTKRQTTISIGCCLPLKCRITTNISRNVSGNCERHAITILCRGEQPTNGISADSTIHIIPNIKQMTLYTSYLQNGRVIRYSLGRANYVSDCRPSTFIVTEFTSAFSARCGKLDGTAKIQTLD